MPKYLHFGQNLPTDKLHAANEANSGNTNLFAFKRASLVAQLVKNPPARQEALGSEDPPEKEKAAHSSILAW